MFSGVARRKAARAGAAALVVVAMTAMSACTIDNGNGSGDQQGGSGDPTSTVEKLNPVVSVADNATDVDPAKPITFEAAPGNTIESATLTNADGIEVDSKFNDDRTTWTTNEVLGYGKTYTLEVKSGGDTTERSFTTVIPNYQASAYVAPMEGSVVGVGQTIAVRFSSPVSDRNAAQDAIEVKTSPEVEGAFFWVNSQEVRWRPAEYWKPGTEVEVKANIYGADLGGGMYGMEDAATKFTIGDEVKAISDDATKTVSVYKNGELIRSMPTSMGTSQWPTPNGVYMVGDKHETLVMDSTTYGLAYDQGGYKTTVDYAVQMSYSGIYFHAAPWSVWAQGSQNTSHGCLNLSYDNAKWVYDNMKRGDIVEVKNTEGETLSGYDGLGDWNIPWETWKAGNADQV